MGEDIICKLENDEMDLDFSDVSNNQIPEISIQENYQNEIDYPYQNLIAEEIVESEDFFY